MKSRHLLDLRGSPVKVPKYRRHLTGDERPDGKAAKRRLKQMERKNLSTEVPHAADSCEVPRADRQDLAYVCSNFLATADDPQTCHICLRPRLAHTAPLLVLDDAGEVPPAAWDEGKGT